MVKLSVSPIERLASLTQSTQGFVNIASPSDKDDIILQVLIDKQTGYLSCHLSFTLQPSIYYLASSYIWSPEQPGLSVLRQLKGYTVTMSEYVPPARSQI